MRVLAALAIGLSLALALAKPAYGDAIDVRATQLASGADYKVRLSAVLWLAKKQDQRAIAALTHALEHDGDGAIRQVAAKALGSLVRARTPMLEQSRAIKALERAAEKDREAKVRTAAHRSLKRLAAVRESMPRVFINIGRPALGKHKVPKGIDVEIYQAVTGVLTQKTPGYQLDWAGQLPTQAELEAQKTRGFFVGTAISELTVDNKNGKVEVQCAVMVQVNPWQGRDAKERWAAKSAASATGKGSATVPNSRRAIDTAKRDCVIAVAEKVVSKQVVPFLVQLVASNP